MRILITGSKGVLGTVLTQTLRARGHDVFGCDLTHSEDLNYMRADVNHSGQIRRVYDEFAPSLTVHLAAEFGRLNSESYPEQVWSTNMLGLQNVIDECKFSETGLIFASSSEAYGLSEQYNPTGAPLYEGILMDRMPKFHNPYALSKYMGEQLIDIAVRNDGLHATPLRFFNIYGPPERYSPYRSVVCQFIYKLLAGLPITVTNDGYRSHLFISDWADTVANVVDGFHLLPYQAFNIGSDDYESIPELFKRIQKTTGILGNVTYIKSETNNSATKRPDNSLAKAWLHHDPKISLDKGLRITVDWMRKEYGL
jgi:dTDP-glucose 4,6-dehydratase